VATRQILRVVLWMTGALLAFSAMAVSIRGLAATLSVMEILALRAALGLMVMAIWAAINPPLRATINPRHLGLHFLRNTVHLGAQYLWASSLLLLPLATVFALEFTTPAWTLLLAVPVLAERMTASRIGAVVLGLVGALVILRPGLQTFRPAALLVLAAAVGLAITLIATKKLTRTDSSFAIIFWMNLIQAPLAFLASQSLFVWKLGAWQIPAIAGIGSAGLIAHYCLANAFRAGDASVVVPLDFMRIPLIAVIGWWLYGETLDVFVFAGAGLIIAGVLWNLRAEARRPAAGADPRR
jgi:drug/metabolite transporter (DMT)-like permease